MMISQKIHAAIPVKRFNRAKSRLADVLTDQQRQQLSQAMLCDVLRAVTGSQALAGAVVISADPDARQIAKQYGAETMHDPAETGPSAAIALAEAYLSSRSGDGMMAIMADVPLVTASELGEMLIAHGPSPAVTLAPARNGLGCNAAICSPTNVIGLRFDGKSLALHHQLAERQGAAVTSVVTQGVGLDIDNADDLEAFCRVRSATQTADLCRDLNLYDRRGVA